MLQRFLKFLNPKRQESSYTIPKPLNNILKFTPNNPELFRQVFTPRGVHRKGLDGKSINYERLEFLGDAMLGAIIAKYLYDKAPGEREGYLTQMRSKIVSRKHLNEIGRNLHLLDYIDRNSTKKISLSQHIEGDIFEALVGAVFLDQGYEAATEFIHRIVIEKYVEIRKLENKISSYKSCIYEWVQKKKYNIEFQTFEEQSAEEIVTFVSTIKLNGKIESKGRGSSKKKAEEIAAKRLYYTKQQQIND